MTSAAPVNGPAAEPPPEVRRLRQEAFEAIQSRKTVTLQAILKQVEDPRLLDVRVDPDPYPDTLLEWAIRFSAHDAVRVLLASGADPMHSRGNNGFTTLHNFACNANAKSEASIRSLVDSLSAAGGDFSAKDGADWTPLHYAIFTGCSPLVQVLIEHGVWVDPKLMHDPDLESRMVPPPSEPRHWSSSEALRLARSLALEKSMLGAMPSVGDPSTKPTTAGLTL